MVKKRLGGTVRLDEKWQRLRTYGGEKILEGDTKGGGEVLYRKKKKQRIRRQGQ